jgi:hypothetical protein
MEDGVASPRSPITICSTLHDARVQSDVVADWRFHAMTDDGDAALAITFYEDFPLASRNSFDRSLRNSAVALTYSVDGQVRIRSTNQFVLPDGTDAYDKQDHVIGGSHFNIGKTQYGTGVLISVDMPNVRSGRIIANLEWLFVESDLLPTTDQLAPGGVLNLVAPRSDVTGRLETVGRSGEIKETIHFRGTGYYDQVSYPEHQRPVRTCLAHAHFPDATIILVINDRETSLCLVKDNQLFIEAIAFEVLDRSRATFGFEYPKHLRASTKQGIEIDVRSGANIDAGFFNLKKFCEIEFSSPDGVRRASKGMIEFGKHDHDNHRLLQKLSSLRVGRNGRSPIF